MDHIFDRHLDLYVASNPTPSDFDALAAYPTLYDPNVWDSSYAYLPPPPTSTQQPTLYDPNAWDSSVPAMPYAYLPPLTPTQQHSTSTPHASTPSAEQPAAKTPPRNQCPIPQVIAIPVSQRPTSNRHVPAQHTDRPKRSSGSTGRPHYAVEKRYRSSLNDRFTALAELVARPATQQICQAQHCDGTDSDKPTLLQHMQPGHKHSKTATLTQALQTIILLERACLRKNRKLNASTSRLNRIANSRQPGPETPSPAPSV